VRGSLFEREEESRSSIVEPRAVSKVTQCSDLTLFAVNGNATRSARDTRVSWIGLTPKLTLDSATGSIQIMA
jgi:hypothetical protein